MSHLCPCVCQPGCLVSFPAQSSLGRASSGWATRPDHTCPPTPTIPSQGLGRRHPQKPGQSQKYVCKKLGNFIELAFLFSGEAEESERSQVREKSKQTWGVGAGQGRAGQGRERPSSEEGWPGAEWPRPLAVPPSLLQGASSSLLLWVLKTEGGTAWQI